MGNITNEERARRVAAAQRRKDFSQTIGAAALVILLLFGLFKFARRFPKTFVVILLVVFFIFFRHHKTWKERKAIEEELFQQWTTEVVEAGITDEDEALKKMVKLCVKMDAKRNEKYYDDRYEDHGNFYRLMNETYRRWKYSNISQEAAKVAIEKSKATNGN